MATNRLDTLKLIVQQDPANSFARYGLAMEYMNRGEVDHAVAEFRTILDRDQNYVPAYFHAAHAFAKAGKTDEARATYEKGIQVATAKGDQHARSELEAALSLLGE